MFRIILRILGVLILAVVITFVVMIALERIGALIDQPRLAGTFGLIPTAPFLGILAHKKRLALRPEGS